MKLKWIYLFFFTSSFLFLALSTIQIKSAEKQDPELQTLTGKLTLIENHFLSTTIQVKKNGKKGGLRSVMAIVNRKTEIKYQGKIMSLKDVPLQSTVHLEYERVKGVIVARKIVIKKIYVKPAAKDKKLFKGS